MKWIEFCILNNISYCVYKLGEKDSIILDQPQIQKQKIIIVLHGIIYIVKIFPNKETLPIAVLNENHIFINKNQNKKIYYRFTALTETFILTFTINNFCYRHIRIPKKFYIIKYYQNTLDRYEATNEIMSQRHIKNRVIQLILLICLTFGSINGQVVVIPFKLSQENISLMTGIKHNTISKFMSTLYKTKILNRSDKKTIYVKKLLKIYLKFNK